MKNIGSTLFFLGILAIGLNFVNMVPRVLMWIYAWGEPTAWAIKVGVVVLGGALWLLGKNDKNEDE